MGRSSRRVSSGSSRVVNTKRPTRVKTLMTLKRLLITQNATSLVQSSVRQPLSNQCRREIVCQRLQGMMTIEPLHFYHSIDSHRPKAPIPPTPMAWLQLTTEPRLTESKRLDLFRITETPSSAYRYRLLPITSAGSTVHCNKICFYGIPATVLFDIAFSKFANALALVFFTLATQAKGIHIIVSFEQGLHGMEKFTVMRA